MRPNCLETWKFNCSPFKSTLDMIFSDWLCLINRGAEQQVGWVSIPTTKSVDDLTNDIANSSIPQPACTCTYI